MSIIIYCILGLILNYLIGCIVLSAFDTNNVYYRWLSRDPSFGLLATITISGWPVLLFFMIKYKKNL